VGYAGGTKDSPTYRSIGDHTETLRVFYDPSVVSYAELLEIFWDSHNPAARPYSRQYMSIILYNSEEQRKEAVKSMKQREKLLGTKIITLIEKAGVFTPAEDYHQKYYLKNSSLMKDLTAYYSKEQGITDSTAAARINGYLAGYGTIEELQEEIDLLGLSKEGKDLLLKRVGPREAGKVSSIFTSILQACGIDPKS
jgi:peptide-methionine (S)-S-oxide reductase